MATRASLEVEIPNQMAAHRSANYQPSSWNYSLLQTLSNTQKEGLNDHLVEKLMKIVRQQMTDVMGPKRQLELIEAVDRLGLASLFQEEIYRVLSVLTLNDGEVVISCGLQSTAICFRLLRRFGFHISEGIFYDFMDGDHKRFMPSLGEDVVGLLSLYHASDMAFQDEQRMDVARSFAMKHMIEKKPVISSVGIERAVDHALELPLQRRMPWMEARMYIDMYELEDNTSSALLQLAKIHFNKVQSIHQKELKQVGRWDIEEIKKLPDYMRICFSALNDTINEVASQLPLNERLEVMPYIKRVWADLFKSFLVEAKWHMERYIPTLKEYLPNAFMSSAGQVILLNAYILLKCKITKETLQQLLDFPNIIRFPSLIFRLCNDLATSSAEQERGDAATSIQCYMNERGASEEEARMHISMLISDAWKEMNREYSASSNPQFPRIFIDASVNLARMATCMYQHGDGFSAPDHQIKASIMSLLLNSIFIDFKEGDL